MRLTDTTRFVTGLAGDALKAAKDQIRGRRVWALGGRAHIEARGVHHPDAPIEYRAALERRLADIEGVAWAAVNGVLGDVVVDFHPDVTSVDRLRETVEKVEREHGMARNHRNGSGHPNSFEPVLDDLLELVGDLAGAGVGLLGRVVPSLSIPPETTAILSVVDLVPQLRKRLEKRFGHDRVELAFSLANSVLGAAARTPLSSLADAALRAVELPAALARRDVWQRRAVELAGDQEHARAAAWPAGERTVPMPDGPIERYTRIARLAAGTASSVLLPTTGLLGAARAIALGAPKAARAGIDAYAAELSRILATRGVVIRDSGPLRMLDRVDTVVIEAAAVTDPASGELDPLAGEIVAAAHEVGRVIVAPIDGDLAERIGADEAVAGGSRLAASIQELQRQGRVVALIGTRNHAAFATADCGIGLVTAGQRPPWAAHLLCGPGLVEAWLVLRAVVTAKKCSDRSLRLAILGATAGALTGFFGRPKGAGNRALLPLSATALVNIGTSVWSMNRLERKPVPVARDTTPWHAMPVEQTLKELRTVLSGLTDEEARRRHHEADVEAGEAPENFVSATLSELDSPLTPPLAAGAGVSAVSGSPLDAAMVAAVMVGNAMLGAGQRVAGSRAVKRLLSAGMLSARLRREDRSGEIVTPASELVPGDIIALQAGDAVPADCRLIEASHLEVDESSLTGESIPVGKNPAPTSAEAMADRSSMLYAGTTVVAGTAIAVVVSVGESTEEGRSAAATEVGEAPSGVEGRLRELTSMSIPLAVAAAAAVLVVGLLRGRPSESISSAVALGVAAVPEGLPFAATAAQLSAARRLSHRNVLVRAPRTLEALGRVNVVCFDKTGTLTAGRIELRQVSDGTVEEPVGALTGHRRAVLATALRASPEEAAGQQLPHPTDRAVTAGGKTAQIARDEGEPGWQQVQELPFESGRGFHAMLGRAGERQVISVKGAPEVVLPRCIARRDDSGRREWTDADRQEIERRVEAMARNGCRVLVVAERSASHHRELDEERVERLDFLGLLCLADPVRPTAAAAVRSLREAGVEVVMLSGDHPSTAEAIAGELNIPTDGRVVTGSELDSLDETALAELAGRTTVFARVSPAHKVAIVRALRRAGRAVAVTGDGANDAPAIRLADVGIALGAQSTPAARQAADIIITDERIETIVDAVIESRAMWRSVRESIALLVGGNLGEIGFTVGSALVSSRAQLNARQLLLVNLLTDLVPALVVAARPPREVTPESLLNEGPDAAVGKALNKDILARAIASMLGTTGGWLAGRAVTPRSASTVAFASLVGSQLAQTAASAKGDPVVLAAVIGSALALIGLIQFPPTSLFFGCRPLGPAAWTISFAAAASAPFVADFAGKKLEGLSDNP